MTAVADTAPGSTAIARAMKSWQEFPTWLPPMLVKELRQGLRSRGFVGIFVLLQAILLITFSVMVGQGDNLAASGINAVFWGILAGLLLFALPLRGLTGLSGELDGRKSDLLVLTPLTAWRIVAGKWFSLVAQGALIAVSLLPYGVMRYFLGEVDLLNDLAIGTSIFVAGAILTGFALWISGWPKGLRILPVLGCVAGLFFVFVRIENAMRFGRGYASGSLFGNVFYFFGAGSGSKMAFPIALALFEGAIFLLFCLNQAARRLAPPAENHASLNRVLALLLLFPILFVAWFGAAGEWLAQFAVSGVAIFLICALELAVVAEPMRVHVREWKGAPAWCRPLGRLLLPGWQSAALFALFPLASAFGIAFACDQAQNPWFELPVFLWALVLGWAALVFPCVLLSALRARPRVVGAGYWIVQAALGIIGATSGNWDITPKTSRGLADLDAFFQMLPGVSLWRLLGWINHPGYRDPLSPSSVTYTTGMSRMSYVSYNDNLSSLVLTPAIVFGQMVMVVVIVVLYLRQSRPSWTLVRERSAGPTVPPR